MMAVFFLGMGYVLRKMEWWQSRYMIIIFAIVIPASLLIEPTKLTPNPTFTMWLLIPFTGLAGYVLVYKLSLLIARRQRESACCLAYIGQKTFYIMTFHFLMFKPASLLYTYINGLDWRMIGCHPVISADDNWFWAIYALTSLVLSIGLAWIVERIPSPAIIIKFKKK